MPTPDVTELWAERELVFDWQLKRWRATRAFDVAYARTLTQAAGAVGSKGVTLNAPHDESETLICTSIVPKRFGFSMYRVTCSYAVPDGGDATNDPNPLKQPPKIRWLPGLYSEASEMDALNRPFLNAAGDPIDPPPPLDRKTILLTVKRFEPYFDVVRATKYIGNINSDQFTIRGKPSNIVVPPGQCRCKSIVPLGEYTLAAKFVETEYVFEFRPNLTGQSQVAADAWDLRFLNQGYQGFYKSGSGSSAKTMKGKLWRGGQEVSAPEPLDANGKPIDPNVTVQGQTPVANPSPLVAKKNFTAYESQQIGKLTLGFLHYDRGLRIAFNGLV